MRLAAGPGDRPLEVDRAPASCRMAGEPGRARSVWGRLRIWECSARAMAVSRQSSIRNLGEGLTHRRPVGAIPHRRAAGADMPLGLLKEPRHELAHTLTGSAVAEHDVEDGAAAVAAAHDINQHLGNCPQTDPVRLFSDRALFVKATARKGLWARARSVKRRPSLFLPSAEPAR